MKRLMIFVPTVMLAVIIILSVGSQVIAAALPCTQSPSLTDTVPDDTASVNGTMVSDAPVVVGPADGALVPINTMNGMPEAVVMAWERADNAIQHTVQVAGNSAFTKIIYAITIEYPTLECSIGQGHNNTVTTPGETYYWKVKASAPYDGPYSEVRSFTCQGISTGGPPIMPSPMNGGAITDQNPEFTWPPLNDVTRYEFQLATNPDFSTLVYTDTPTTSGILIPGTMKLEIGTQYFWRVRALEPVQGDWSSLLNFMVTSPNTTMRPPHSITVAPAPTSTPMPDDAKDKPSLWQRVIDFFKNLFGRL